MDTPITLKTAIDEFVLAKSIQLSKATLIDYNLTFRRAKEFFGQDKIIADITPRDVRGFLATIPGSKKNQLNAWTGLSSLWTFCQEEGFTRIQVIHKVDKPKPVKKVIPRFSEDEVRRIMLFSEWSAVSHCEDRVAFSTHRGTAVRNRAIVLTLLDTGLRASELCNLRTSEVNGKYLKVTGKGAKEREVPASPTTWEAIRDYMNFKGMTWESIEKIIANRPELNGPLFLSDEGTQLTTSGLLQLCKRIGDAGGIAKCHPHRFRHTFAVNFLINGGNPYALKAILGHSTLTMVERYLDLVREDIGKAHETASPVTKWAL